MFTSPSMSLDQSVGRAKTFATAGGASLPQPLAVVTQASELQPFRGAALTAYDPLADADGRAGQAALTVATHRLALAARRSRTAT